MRNRTTVGSYVPFEVVIGIVIIAGIAWMLHDAAKGWIGSTAFLVGFYAGHFNRR